MRHFTKILRIFAAVQTNQSKSMEIQNLLSTIQVCSLEELSAEEQNAIQLALEGTNRSYTPYSKFHVGAGVVLNNGQEFVGCCRALSPVCCRRAVPSGAGQDSCHRRPGHRRRADHRARLSLRHLPSGDHRDRDTLPPAAHHPALRQALHLPCGRHPSADAPVVHRVLKRP